MPANQYSIAVRMSGVGDIVFQNTSKIQHSKKFRSPTRSPDMAAPCGFTNFEYHQSQTVGYRT